MTQIKRHRIDWDNIKITFVPADTENPNPLNPYSRMTPGTELCRKEDTGRLYQEMDSVSA